MAYSVIFPTLFLQGYDGKTGSRQQVGTLAGESIKIMNLSPYGVSVYVNEVLSDYVAAYDYLIMANSSDIALVLDAKTMSAYTHPSENVAVKTFEDILSYEIGSLIQTGIQAPQAVTNVAGSVNIGNTVSATINSGSVNIANVPTMNIAANQSIGISGTANVSIQNTPSVNINNTSIAVTNTPGASLTVAGTINVGTMPNVTISSGSVNATITGTPTFAISASSNAVTVSSGTINIGTMPGVQINNSTTNPVITNVNNAITIAANQSVNIGNTVATTISSGSVSISNSPSVSVTSGTVSIGNTPSVTVTNNSLNVATAAGTSLTVAGTINIGNSPSVTVSSGSVTATISGTPSVTLSGTANSVTINGTPTMNIAANQTVGISGTANVSITNTPSVTLSGTANSVTINGTPNVAITGTPTVNVTNSSIAVTNTSGGSLTVAGTINIGNSPTVNIAANQSISISGTPTVSISNTPSVTISNTPSVNATIQNAQISTSVVNDVIQVNPLTVGTTSNFTVTNLAVGASTTFSISVPLSLYDQVTLRANSSGSFIGSYGFQLNKTVLNAYGLIAGSYGQNFVQEASNSSIYLSKMLVLSSTSIFDTIQITVTNNGTATIASDTLTLQAYCRYASNSIDNTINAVLTGTNTVNIGNTPNVSITGTPSVTLSGTTNTVQISGTPTMNIAANQSVGISGTANVSITNTPSVTLSGTANSVTINGTPNVSITNTPNVNINNTSIAVTNTAGGSLTVAGTINIGNTPSVTVSSGTVNIGNSPTVNIAANQSVAISSGSVNATIQNAQLNSNVINASMPFGENVSKNSNTFQYTVANLASNSNIGTQSMQMGLGIFDEIYFSLYSSAGLITDYEVYVYGTLLSEQANNYTYTINAACTRLNYSSNGGTYSIAISPSLADEIYFTVVNTSTGAIASDTLKVFCYGKYSSQTVENPASNPVNSQPATGSFWQQQSFDIQNAPMASNNYNSHTLIPSGGYIKHLQFTPSETGGTDPCYVTNGGSVFWRGTQNGAFQQFDFGDGVPNNGIILYSYSSGGSQSTSCTGYGITTTQPVGTPHTTQTA